MISSNVVNMHVAKSTLSKLVEKAEAGEEVLIARAGLPVVRLTPLRQAEPRVLGLWQGQVQIHDDFDAPLDDESLSDWESI